ncbi:glycine betaine/proline transport system permease protein/glycine betaine/proline transport system substrate-binding protein [Alkalibaculum bacchi]|uniref:Glycine betaine/proline transport system permease protein/glycine betaine/proline transport system substrate-binding protein n=1 Tax=Alkalibaculum bacchi TaxID=645887 RepID=A0A366I221_9FIRM|nr:glycine betaine ABC transporter substrate-binding protein [Alkalibaculum bacchi]RBP61385.1 glycine betaine/proline transport system permease protein/glycine betaine/proline transport system substrate-binding protein [Alkalibaculum bacchi]
MRRMKNKGKVVFALLLVALMCSFSVGYADTPNKEIAFADAGWDSVKFHNAVAGFIAEELYGYSWREVPGSSTVLHEGLINGEIDVHMEEWTNNLATYDEDVEAGKLKDLGINFDDNYQGFYVPRYVIEGDKTRGIEPSAPDLKTVEDLKKYPDVFPDAESQSKGRIYGGIPGWEVDKILHNKFLHYGLDENFIYFRPGSDSALASAITGAYDRGEPIVAYYWEPTWLMGMYDMVLLQDEPYDPATYNAGKTALPPVKVTVGVSNEFYDNNPEMVEFLSNYQTSSALTSEALAYMQETGANYKETAKWFLQEHDELIDKWLNEEDATTLRSSLNDDTATSTIGWFKEIPFRIPLDLQAIDQSVRDFSVKHDNIFNAIRGALSNFVNGIYFVLNSIPWFIFILLVFIAGWKVTNNVRKGILYAVLLLFVGLLGLWSLMNETLSIVIASVFISLILGFPLGIFISMSDRADRIVRPILDTMQTMPVFVYLIPALLFFGLGKPPAVIATTIYAIVPIIRMTSHGIKQIDKEVVEASIAFGSTRLQSLIKVQIPQALPTIMTGVNQTIMMAMSMVVTTSMIGATGLGMEVLISVNRVEIGRGLVSGISVVILAVILDRITQGLVKKSEVNTNDR